MQMKLSMCMSLCLCSCKCWCVSVYYSRFVFSSQTLFATHWHYGIWFHTSRCSRACLQNTDTKTQHLMSNQTIISKQKQSDQEWGVWILIRQEWERWSSGHADWRISPINTISNSPKPSKETAHNLVKLVT